MLRAKQQLGIDESASSNGCDVAPSWRARSRSRAGLGLLTLMLWLSACGANRNNQQVAGCDAACTHSVALRGMREMIKLAYNLTLQGKPVGEQNAQVPCPLGGQVNITGMARSNAEQGATELDLKFEFVSCGYLQRDDQPAQNYKLTLNGVVAERGILAVQPSATTALVFSSTALDVAGTVYDPPIEYAGAACSVQIAQNGNRLSGIWCDQETFVEL